MYFCVPGAGILLNGYVLFRLIKVARKSVVRFETTSGLPLAAMSIGDSITLLSLLTQVIIHIIPKQNVPIFIFTAICKGGVYLIHTTSAFSVWCWLVLSVLRYTAVFHPIKYRTIWRQPRNALKVLAVSICIFESWILLFVTYHESEQEKGCSEHDDIDARNIKFAHLGDIFLFYAIPSLLRIMLDFIVLVHCYSPFSNEGFDRRDRRYAISGPATKRFSESGEIQTIVTKNNVALALSIAALSRRSPFPRRKTVMVIRSIIISVLNLLLNLPSHILRVWATIDDSSLKHDIVNTIEPIAQMLYFSQFACNAFYLATSIYETNGSPRNTVIASSNRHISRCISEEEKLTINNVNAHRMSRIVIFVQIIASVSSGQIPVHPIFSPCQFPLPITEPGYHRQACNTMSRLPFICDLHHSLAHTNTIGIEKAYKRYKYVFTNGNASTLAVIIAKQLEQPVTVNDVMNKPEYACLFDNECDQIDGDIVTAMVGNVKKFLMVYSWKVYERWFGAPAGCSKANLLALVVIDGVVNDARKIPYVRLHTGAPRLRFSLSNIQSEINNALVQGWPLAKVIEDLVDDVGYAMKEFDELNGEQRDHSVPLWARNLFLICLALVVTALFIEWYVVRRKIGVQKSGSIKIASAKSKTHLMF
ncbi:unnamed protein product [Caenorhabditis bovis]|uniref:G-protein coupled receptors family 1 profile domain-containing protein n=1 Tax=Caenorhabditis bovis TaxID=2654633 RepID=A0A8S1EJ87_9PELO|nr:unnamed protein product [Caenorhabditis bovis]